MTQACHWRSRVRVESSDGGEGPSSERPLFIVGSAARLRHDDLSRLTPWRVRVSHVRRAVVWPRVHQVARRLVVAPALHSHTHAHAVLDLHTLFLQPVKPRWPSMCICMYMVRVGVRVSIRVRVWVRVSVSVWVRFRVCHYMFRTRSSMFDRLWK